jgi:hypothetical protein
LCITRLADQGSASGNRELIRSPSPKGRDNNAFAISARVPQVHKAEVWTRLLRVSLARK